MPNTNVINSTRIKSGISCVLSQSQMFHSGWFVLFLMPEIYSTDISLTWLVTPFFLWALWTLPRTTFLMDTAEADEGTGALGLFSCWFPPFMCCSYGNINLRFKNKSNAPCEPRIARAEPRTCCCNGRWLTFHNVVWYRWQRWYCPDFLLARCTPLSTSVER